MLSIERIQNRISYIPFSGGTKKLSSDIQIELQRVEDDRKTFYMEHMISTFESVALSHNEF